MKRFVLRVLLFFICIALLDFCFGYFFSLLRVHAKGGSTANCEYIANQTCDDIIILGSSRATHHYIPQIIEDSLGMSCYNCGEEGNGIVLAYGRLKMIISRHKPKMVIYEVTPGFDYGTKDPNNKYLGYLRAYYDKDEIKCLFDDFDDEMSFLKMRSRMYQNNSRLLPNLFDCVIYRDNNKGYDPLYGQIKVPPKNDAQKSEEITEIDNHKLAYVEKLIVMCKTNDIPLLFMISPWYNYGGNLSEYEPALQLCDKYSIDVHNSLTQSLFSQAKELFQDNCHLNNDGAIVYTKSIIPFIRRSIFK